jgi:REP element-mobilizing transposase RayT
MGRPWRIEYKGASYHILSRGNERRDIFFDLRDYHLFLDTVGEMAERFELEIFAYVLMPNHYHLLLKTHRKNLSKSMHWFGVAYTNRINARHSRCGHLFQGRYKSLLVQNDAYLLRLSCYIHRNPLRTGLVKRLVDYRWSSYPAYAYNKKSQDWLSMDTILKQFDAKDKKHAYREKVQGYADEEKRLWEDFRHGMIVGSEQFVEKIREKFLPPQPHKEIISQKEMSEIQDPAKKVQKAAKILGADLKRFRESLRISAQDRDTRDILVYFIRREGVFTNQEIGEIFGVSYSAISHIARRVKERLQYDREMKTKYETLYSQFKI